MFTHDDINEISLDNYFQGLKISFTTKWEKVEFIDKPTKALSIMRKRMLEVNKLDSTYREFRVTRVTYRCIVSRRNV